jgi:hypothetical protein
MKQMTQAEAREEIKKHLWGWNLRVRDVAGIAPYDLLVNGKIKMIVVTSKPREAECMRVAACDAVAVVVDKKNRFYSIGVNTNSKNGLRCFGEYVRTPSKIIPGPKSP